MFYTYVWRDGAGVPFYVGKGGRDRGRRARSLSGRSHEFTAMHSQGGCTVGIVDEFIHESEAHAGEVELIERYGRREDGGLLVNKTVGGEGILGLVHTSDAKEKIRAANVGKKLSAEHRAKIGAAHAGKITSQECKDKISASLRRLPPQKNEFKGVSYRGRDGKWQSIITIRSRVMVLGAYATPHEAAAAYDAAAYAEFGEDCYLNFRDKVVENGRLGLAVRSQGRS